LPPPLTRMRLGYNASARLPLSCVSAHAVLPFNPCLPWFCRSPLLPACADASDYGSFSGWIQRYTYAWLPPCWLLATPERRFAAVGALPAGFCARVPRSLAGLLRSQFAGACADYTRLPTSFCWINAFARGSAVLRLPRCWFADIMVCRHRGGAHGLSLRDYAHNATDARLL